MLLCSRMTVENHISAAIIITSISLALSMPLIHQLGTFTFGGFLFILMLFVIFYSISSGKIIKISPLASKIVVPLSLLVALIMGFIFFDQDLNGIRSLAQLLFRLSYFSAIALTIYWLCKALSNKAVNVVIFPILIALAFILKICIIHISQQPVVDIFDILQYGPKALLAGKNPYQEYFGGIIDQPLPSGVKSFISYWPVAIYVLLPFSIFTDDPRYALIFYELILAVLMWKNANKVPIHLKAMPPLYLLYFPFFTTAVSRSFIDMAILLMVFLAFKANRLKKSVLSGFYWGLVIGMKYLYLPPMIMFFDSLKLIKRNWLIFFSFILTLVMIIAPFLLWDKYFLQHTILDQIGEQFSPLTRFSLNVYGFIWMQFGNLKLVQYWTIFSILTYIILIKNKFFISIEAKYTTILFILILFFPQSLGEQYYFLAGCMLITSHFLLLENKSSF